MDFASPSRAEDERFERSNPNRVDSTLADEDVNCSYNSYKLGHFDRAGVRAVAFFAAGELAMACKVWYLCHLSLLEHQSLTTQMS